MICSFKSFFLALACGLVQTCVLKCSIELTFFSEDYDYSALSLLARKKDLFINPLEPEKSFLHSHKNNILFESIFNKIYSPLRSSNLPTRHSEKDVEFMAFKEKPSINFFEKIFIEKKRSLKTTKISSLFCMHARTSNLEIILGANNENNLFICMKRSRKNHNFYIIVENNFPKNNLFKKIPTCTSSELIAKFNKKMRIKNDANKYQPTISEILNQTFNNTEHSQQPKDLPLAHEDNVLPSSQKLEAYIQLQEEELFEKNISRSATSSPTKHFEVIEIIYPQEY